MQRFHLKRYVEVLNGKIIDTTLLLPHVECYFIEDDKLFVEHIDGSTCYLGKVVKETDDLAELAGLLEIDFNKAASQGSSR